MRTPSWGGVWTLKILSLIQLNLVNPWENLIDIDHIFLRLTLCTQEISFNVQTLKPKSLDFSSVYVHSAHARPTSRSFITFPIICLLFRNCRSTSVKVPRSLTVWCGFSSPDSLRTSLVSPEGNFPQPTTHNSFVRELPPYKNLINIPFSFGVRMNEFVLIKKSFRKSSVSIVTFNIKMKFECLLGIKTLHLNEELSVHYRYIHSPGNKQLTPLKCYK